VYPSNLQTNLRRREGAYVQTSLSRAFLLDGQTRLSWVARSTLSSKMSCELRASSYEQTDVLVCSQLAARSLKPNYLSSGQISLLVLGFSKRSGL